MNRSTHAFLLAIGGLTTLFVAVWIGTAFVLTAQQDTLAEKASRKLLKTAFAARRDNLERFALDYTSWDSAYEMVAAHDLDWAYGNMGSSVELGTFDNMTIAYPDGTSFGWTSETADELVSSPVPSFAVAAMKSRLSGLEFGLRAIGYIWIDDAFWLYTAA